MSKRRFNLPGLTVEQTHRYGWLLLLTIPVTFFLCALDAGLFNSVWTYYVGAVLFLIPGGYWVMTGDLPWEEK